MALSHGDLALNQNVIGIVDDTIQNGIGDGALPLVAGVNTLVLPIGVILGTENNGTVRFLSASAFHDFQ